MFKKNLSTIIIVIAVVMISLLGLGAPGSLSALAQGNTETLDGVNLKESYATIQPVSHQPIERSRAMDVTRWMVQKISTSNAAMLVHESVAQTWVVESERWTALAKYYIGYQPVEFDPARRNLQAEATRWTAMGKYYTRLQVNSLQGSLRSRAADTARWDAMVTYYTGKQVNLMEDLARSRTAEAERWTAMVAYFTLK